MTDFAELVARVRATGEVCALCDDVESQFAPHLSPYQEHTCTLKDDDVRALCDAVESLQRERDEATQRNMDILTRLEVIANRVVERDAARIEELEKEVAKLRGQRCGGTRIVRKAYRDDCPGCADCREPSPDA